MKLNHLNIHNYRNYNKVNLNFSDGINILIGNNAQGKTNLLEAIYVLALTRSQRTHNNSDLIKWNQSNAQIKGQIKKSTGNLHLELDLNRKGKIAKANYIEQAKLSSYLGNLNVILFSPEDLSIVKGSPLIRRRFMDMEFGQMSNQYLYNITQYKRVLQQRNHYLKSLQIQQSSDLVYLDVLSDQLASFGSKILIQRLKLLKQLEKWSNQIHSTISQGTEKLRFKYLTTLNDQSLNSTEDVYSELTKSYKKEKDREIHQGTTVLGPHRDDLRFIINGKDVQTFGSQGQQRTTALSVKLAEIDLMKSQTGEYPILLLDDVLSELDNNRQTHLLRAIQNKVQTFLTTTNFSGVARDLIHDPRIFRITDGQVKESDH